VTDWLVFWLLAKDVLRLDWIGILTTTERQIPEMKEELPVESLIKMAVLTDSPMNLKRASQWDLSGSVLKLYKVLYGVVSGNIDRVMNLNAENLEVGVCVNNFAAISSLILPKPSGLVTDRIKNFRFNYLLLTALPLNEFPHEHVRVQADYILKCCTKLEKLYIGTMSYHAFPDASFDSFVQQIKSFNEELKSGPLMNCETHGCELIFAVRANFPAETLINAIDNEHEVMKLGERCNNDDWPIHLREPVMILREVKLKEKLFARYVFIGHD